MAAKGINIAEECHVVCLHPIDVGGVAKTIYASMADWHHASIIVTSGAAANMATLEVYCATSNAGAGEHAISFNSYDAGATDVMGTRTYGASVAQSVANSILVIEVDASELTVDHKFIGVKTSAAAANIISIVIVFSGGRYQSDASRTMGPS
jgi:hypothetical protein